jgi:signal transduction histidine kinase
LNLKNAALQSAIQANKRLLAGVSHEPPTPQTPIVGNSHLSESASVNPETPPKQETDGAYTPDSGLHLSSSIGELLEISMDEEGGWQPDEKLIDLPKFLKSIRPMLQASLADASITLSILDSPDPAVLYGDEGAVRRLLTTIVDNAAKHSGGTNVEISMITQSS